ncbi:uncharacterized protein PHALS_11931 [Plasmopara halstedii]|uniref:Uncharacterized protein n=1 Tax=Plasmopara halstedii TaxID=4781 RepID=A0A0P1AKZ3_PLAHL|nr:uncharacterized protein PHALS_11931 [Plasmopara halstedii]CEG41596.1 hypothetical protein PHALS_11931 [Plasmopara halstedii]|eukprot:XP_024577965.1 hypothetical protein PHALS_11931 [Plasmopara halstedii]
MRIRCEGEATNEVSKVLLNKEIRFDVCRTTSGVARIAKSGLATNTGANGKIDQCKA